MSRLVLIVVLCIGCSRSSLPDPIAPAPDDDTVVETDEDTVDSDDDIVVPPTAKLCGLAAGAWVWTAPQLMPDVEALLAPLQTNPTASVFDPILSEDGLTLFLSTDLTAPWDVYALTRPSLTASFDHIELMGPDVNVPGVTSFGYQPLASLGTALAFGDFPVSGIAAGTYVVVLADITVTPFVWRGLAIDSAQTGLGDPRLTGDGEALVLAVANESALRHIFLSKRTAEGDFGAGTLVAGLTDADESAPWLSTDRRVLLFAHSGDQTQIASDIWSATRVDPDGPFENAGPIAALNSTAFDGEPYFFESGGTCELYLVSRQSVDNAFKVYRSFLTRP